MLEILVIPACFLAAGLIGFRLGTPPRVAGGLVAVGCCHLLAFLVSSLALAATGSVADWVHLVSQWLFLGGFVAIAWLAATYPRQKPSRAFVTGATSLGVVGPLLAGMSGSTPAVSDGGEQLGPVVRLLPGSLAQLAAAPLVVLPLMAVIAFGVRYHRATGADRAAMRWPVLGSAFLLIAALGGLLLPSHDELITGLFLLTAPALPLALAFGPVSHRLDALTAALAERTRPRARPAALATLTPREYAVLEAMAQGAANPVIARQLHISLSSVEKHATSIFRKLEVAEGPEVHRRVAAVVAYRDALEPTAPEG